ncbi:hypothetical protein BJ508DRAFT_240542 [Ascobolus immersus RN42]|uniref:Jacalin-type lectin domain-containing protein n=1 Tax=Ascobolus immersus RN42 TaxID=1160509 RepID=A0A3N4I0I3_ASCIM|nr:hypothetical protein BJ508DRAFT_240542 [Ascobolus immersus RN42]
MRFHTSIASLALLQNSIVALAATSGTFNVLTYNVAGLPELISSSNPKENTPYISAKLTGYNIINVQEDFNYHAALYASNNHPHGTSTSGGVPFGDGLNTLSDYPWTDLERVKWKDCNANSGDCLTPKGYTFMRLRLDEGVWVDVYNLHTDAGGDANDLKARASNIAQVVQAIATNSVGMPVIVMGDTNIRYTTAGDSIRALVQGAGLTDAWVKHIRNGVEPTQGTPALGCPFPFPSGTDQTCETVDKILYRSSPAISLTSTAFSNDHEVFLHPKTGVPLSDHYPLRANMVWSASPSFRLGDEFGGPHGSYFHDLPLLTAGTKISSIALAGGNRLDRISVRTGTGSVLTHGGSGGSEKNLTLEGGDRVVEVMACSAQYNSRTRIFYLRVKTAAGKQVETGKTTTSCKTWTAQAGEELKGFWGRAGDNIDRVGPIWGKSS